MVVLRTFILLLGAFAVLALGAVSAPAPAEAAVPPCHETGHSSAPDGSSPTPDKPMKSMGCCVACVATVAPEPPLRTGVALPAPLRVADITALPVGTIPSPEPQPPRSIHA